MPKVTVPRAEEIEKGATENDDEAQSYQFYRRALFHLNQDTKSSFFGYPLPMHTALSRLVIFSSVLFFLTTARADTHGTPSTSSAPPQRWSLAEWLDQRDRMRMMDLWLALHSPSPYEFYTGLSFQSGRSAFDTYYSGWNLHFGAFASIFGLEVQRDFNVLQSRWISMFLIRILGKRVQATNITIQLGAKQEDRFSDQLWNLLTGIDATLYINRYFGIEGLYRHYWKASVGSTLGKIGGDRYEANAFIDFKFLRVYGGYFNEYESQEGLAGDSRRGGQLGVRAFF
jgi:hypothetical protein